MTSQQYRALLNEGSPEFRALQAKEAVKKYGKPKDRMKRGMNKTEACYADRLALMKLAGQIRSYEYVGNQRKRYRMDCGGGHTYTPDFAVEMCDGSIQYHEVKGFAWTKDVLRFDGAAEKHPGNVFRMFRRTKHGWDEIRTRNIQRGAEA